MIFVINSCVSPAAVLMRARARADCCSGPRRQGCCNSEGMRRLPLLLLLLHDVVGEAHDGRATRFVQLVGVPPPNAASWVAAWLGVYREASHIPESIDGRRTYIKEEDPGKVLWHTSSGWWNVGHWHDVNTGAAMMAVKDAALTPDKVHAPWSVVTGSVPSHEIARGLACVPAFPFMLWLGGHAPKETGRSWLSRGWVANWFGTYVLSDESINGWPSYCRRTTKGGSGDPECGASSRSGSWGRRRGLARRSVCSSLWVAATGRTTLPTHGRSLGHPRPYRLTEATTTGARWTRRRRLRACQSGSESP
jgi:hypothetical protein